MTNHILGRPFKKANSQFPPTASLLSLMNSSEISRMLSCDSDCSEIAERFYASAMSGAILYYADISFE